MLKIIAKNYYFNPSFTFHIQAIILKFIWSKKLKTNNKIEYFKIIQDWINFSQNNVNANISANTKKKMLNIIHIIIKFFENICFIVFIFFISFFECISDIIGKSNQKIGVIIIKGIDIILR